MLIRYRLRVVFLASIKADQLVLGPLVLEGIEEFHTETVEVFDVARENGEPLPQRPFRQKTWIAAAFSRNAIVDLPEAERAQLDALCRQRGLSRAEALRQALRLWLEQQKPSHGEVFGLWRDRPEGSLELQQALRQEWDAP